MRKAAHNGCCRRVAQTRALCSILWKLLVSQKLVEVLMEIEIPLVRSYETLVHLKKSDVMPDVILNPIAPLYQSLHAEINYIF